MLREFANAIKLKILNLEDHPELSKWVQYNHMSPYARKIREGDVTPETESERVLKLLCAGLENGGRGHDPSNIYWWS